VIVAIIPRQSVKEAKNNKLEARSDHSKAGRGWINPKRSSTNQAEALALLGIQKIL
jgi:hypothetical protein